METVALETRPHKRIRSDVGNALEDLVKDEEVWLPDGNLVVVAQNIAFRVLRSILAYHSDVFRDLFSLPPANVNDVFDGCPVVVLEGDDPVHLRHLFLVLFYGRK